LLRELGRPRREIADACGVSRTAVSWWRSGRRLPSAAARRALERHFGIPVAAWGELRSWRRVTGAEDLASIRYRALVRELVERRGGAKGTHAAVARELGVVDTYVSTLLEHESKVRPALLERATRRLGVPAEYFTDVDAELDAGALPPIEAAALVRLSKREVAARLRALAVALDPPRGGRRDR
jgi:transcriptional regulator with XRE-family HTH domain